MNVVLLRCAVVLLGRVRQIDLETRTIKYEVWSTRAARACADPTILSRAWLSSGKKNAATSRWLLSVQPMQLLSSSCGAPQPVHNADIWHTSKPSYNLFTDMLCSAQVAHSMKIPAGDHMKCVLAIRPDKYM